MKFVDVTNDLAFRKIFGNENKKEVLISFLNAVIVLPKNNKIIEVTIVNPYQLPNLGGGKTTIVDVKAKDQNENVFIVEMQVAEPVHFSKRVLYYTSQNYSEQISRGDNYDKLNPAYFIGILDFEISKNKKYLTRHRVLDVETGENIIRDIEFNFIELPKFNLELKDLKTDIEQWVYFIKNAENLEIIPDSIQDSGLKVAYLEADKHTWTKQELSEYNNIFIRERDDLGRLELATKKASEKGLQEGLEKGLEKGLEQGMEQGMEKGKLEEKLEIAKQLLKNNIPIEIIISSTRLTKGQIEKL